MYSIVRYLGFGIYFGYSMGFGQVYNDRYLDLRVGCKLPGFRA